MSKSLKPDFLVFPKILVSVQTSYFPFPSDKGRGSNLPSLKKGGDKGGFCGNSLYDLGSRLHFSMAHWLQILVIHISAMI